MLRAASVLLVIAGLGFGLPCLPAIRAAAADRPVPTLFGFPAYGHGPFERRGIKSSVPLLVAFLVVCLAECVAGVLLWNGHKSGALLALALLPAGGVFWWGFALPFGPILALASAALMLVGWPKLR